MNEAVVAVLGSYIIFYIISQSVKYNRLHVTGGALDPLL